MRKRKKDNFFKVCPKCGSRNSYLSNLIEYGGNNLMKCKDCRYEGIFPEVREKDIGGFKKLLKKGIK